MNNKFYFPSIRSNVDSFYVMSLLSKASNLERKGKEIFHFEASYYGSQHPPLRTSCDTYCSTGLIGKNTTFLENLSFSAPRAQN